VVSSIQSKLLIYADFVSSNLVTALRIFLVSTIYLVSGLSVLSDHTISTHMAHGWQQTDSVREPVDVTIQTFDIAAYNPTKHRNSKTDFVFQPKPGLFFRIMAGSNILIYRSSEIGDRDVTIFLIGSAWGVLCHQRGLLPLHCSAIASSSTAIAFIGQSGSGKSTLAASFCQEGYDHVCDDVAIVDVSPASAVTLRAMPKGLKLWREATETLNLKPLELVTNDENIEKYYVDLPRGTGDKTLDLAAIYTLNFDDGISKPEIRKINGSVLLQILYINIYRVEWINRICDPAKILSKTLAIANSVPVYQFSRPRSLKDLRSSTHYLGNHFSKIG